MEQLQKETKAAPKEDISVLLFFAVIAFLFVAALLGFRLYQAYTPIIEAKRELESRLKDPYSVKYSDVRECPAGNGVRGQYNAKNGYGAYAGNESFLYVNGELATLGDDNFLDLLDLCYDGRIKNEKEGDSGLAEALGQ